VRLGEAPFALAFDLASADELEKVLFAKYRSRWTCIINIYGRTE
jgi:hypothetical protein